MRNAHWSDHRKWLKSDCVAVPLMSTYHARWNLQRQNNYTEYLSRVPRAALVQDPDRLSFHDLTRIGERHHERIHLTLLPKHRSLTIEACVEPAQSPAEIRRLSRPR